MRQPRILRRNLMFCDGFCLEIRCFSLGLCEEIQCSSLGNCVKSDFLGFLAWKTIVPAFDFMSEFHGILIFSSASSLGFWFEKQCRSALDFAGMEDPASTFAWKFNALALNFAQK